MGKNVIIFILLFNLCTEWQPSVFGIWAQRQVQREREKEHGETAEHP